jgi:hypothetical protein
MQRLIVVSPKSATHFVRRFSAAVELREYSLKPSHAGQFLQMADATGALRKQLAPLRLFAVSNTGGQLNTAFHFYYHPSLQRRDDAARAMRAHAQWSEFESHSARCCDRQSSCIYAEAPFVAGAYGGMATEIVAGNGDCAAVYEIRRYRLVLGYDTVPRFMDHYSSGLSSKLDASKEAGSRFCSLLYTEVGHLNEVLEIWRHNGVSGMEQARVLSRQSQPWKVAVANIAPLALSFSNTLLTPTPFSNWC